jgi:uncharacterized protein YkwD
MGIGMRRKTLIRGMALAAFALFVASCTTTGQKQVSTHIPVEDVSQEAVGLINSFRASHGLSAVIVDPTLVEAARYQAVAMASANVLSHEIGGDFNARMNSAGFVYANAAENVGAGHTSVEDAINAWIRSPHHRENMLMPDATRIGMVRADAPSSRYRNYWALDLASAPAGSPQKILPAKAPATVAGKKPVEPASAISIGGLTLPLAQ